MTCQESLSLGAYLLGALDGGERNAIERHLAGCVRCRDELAAMAPLPGLLRHTPFEEMPETAQAAEALSRQMAARIPASPAELAGSAGWGIFETTGSEGSPPPVDGSPSPGDTGHRTSSTSSHRRGPKARRALTAASMAVAACATAVAVYLGFFKSDAPAAQPVAATLSATDSSTHVAATAGLVRKGWGTEIDLKVGGLPHGIRCTLVVHTKDGRTETGGTWTSGDADTATVPASTSVSPDAIGSIDIMSDSGRRLVQLTQSA